ncbi:aminotransferase class V-fold PLP-dependent enzyme [Oceanobacillus sp. 1P07AA]|uniref:aminotransferase class V-fold PLP-dependent enzyme n=1 Tax=Oceanobacillus sp. 1P07AA TaxID=3132293 RepID=UPI0039A4DC62
MVQISPLNSISLEEAQEAQFRLVDTITKHFNGNDILSTGDLGVRKEFNKPSYTKKIEDILADYFQVECAKLVRGAGTGALRFGFMSFLKPNDKLLIHSAPVYPTSKTTLDAMGINLIEVDFHNQQQVESTILNNSDLKGVLIQHTRQKIDDSYDFAQLIHVIQSINSSLTIITDDNYAAMKVNKVGAQLGADLSTFSLFKLLGPEGVGLVLGKTELIDEIEAFNYSGGSQVQGYEALEALRGLIYAPVMLAIQANVNEQLVNQLNDGIISNVKRAFLANAQSKVLIVELDRPIAERVLHYATALGAAPHPIGAESKYEFVPMFYKVSGTFLKANPELKKTMIRINPLRSGPDTILRILSLSIERAMRD